MQARALLRQDGSDTTWEMVFPDSNGHVGGLLGEQNVADLFAVTNTGEEYVVMTVGRSRLLTASVLGYWSEPSAWSATDEIRLKRDYEAVRKSVVSPKTGKVSAGRVEHLRTTAADRLESFKRALTSLKTVRLQQQAALAGLLYVLSITLPDEATYDRYLGELQTWWVGLVGTCPRSGPRAGAEGEVVYRTPSEVMGSMRGLLSGWTHGGHPWNDVGTAVGVAHYQAEWLDAIRVAAYAERAYHVPAGMLLAYDDDVPVQEKGGGEDGGRFAQVVEALTLLVLMNTPKSSLTLDDAVFCVRPSETKNEGAGDFIVDRRYSIMSSTGLFREIDEVLGLTNKEKDSSLLKMYQRRTKKGEVGWPFLEGSQDERVAQIFRAAGRYAERAVTAGRSTKEVYGEYRNLPPL